MNTTDAIQSRTKPRFPFPRWSNRLPLFTAVGVVFLLSSGAGALWYYGSPKHTDVGYSPVQPIAYSHPLHAGDLGISCLYCHTSADTSSVASVPPTQICMNCHDKVKTDSPEIKKLTDYHTRGIPVPWIRIHKTPDYAYFPHNRHVTRGVGCAECHGRIDKMERVQQDQPLSMGWCLDCHRDPGPRLRPQDAITQMDWQPPAGQTRESVGQQLLQQHEQERLPIRPPAHDTFVINCSGCHR